MTLEFNDWNKNYIAMFLGIFGLIGLLTAGKAKFVGVLFLLVSIALFVKPHSKPPKRKK